MKKKHKLLLSFILLVVCIVLIFCGVVLFDKLPEVTTNGYENPKHAMIMTGAFFSFLLGFFAFCGSIGFLIYTFYTED